jgi:outer membrane protein OmpA-like peptidoglycan-associated protein
MSRANQWLFETPLTQASSYYANLEYETPLEQEWEISAGNYYNVPLTEEEWEGAPCGGIQYRRRPGKTKEGLIYTNAESTAVRDVLLYDFDIDSYDLKPNHENELDSLIKFMIDNLRRRKSGEKWRITLDGYASRTGEKEHNRVLSQCRSHAVSNYILAHFPKPDSGLDLFSFIEFSTTGHGFESTTVQGEDPLGRSVRVTVHPPKDLPPPIILPTQKSTKFRIRSHGTVSGGLSKEWLIFPGLQDKLFKLLEQLKYLKWLKRLKVLKYLAVDVAIFELLDVENRRFAFFLYVGGGPQVPVPLPLPPASASGAGAWLDFETTKPLRLEDFIGPAQLLQPPAAGKLNFGNVILTPKSNAFGIGVHQARTKPKHLELDTGPTYGVTILSQTYGKLILLEIGNLQAMNFRQRQLTSHRNQTAKPTREQPIASRSTPPNRGTISTPRPRFITQLR